MRVCCVNALAWMDLPESSLKSSQRLPPATFFWSSEEALEALESSEDESPDDEFSAAQKRDMLC